MNGNPIVLSMGEMHDLFAFGVVAVSVSDSVDIDNDKIFIPSLPVFGYDGYAADVWGCIWSSRTKNGSNDWFRLNQPRNSKGYGCVSLVNDMGSKQFLAHRLLCRAYYGPAPVGKGQVRHLDGDKSNNKPCNLDWGSQSQNWQDRIAHGVAVGEDHHASKFTLAQVRSIRGSNESRSSIARKYGVSLSTISNICRGITWREGVQIADINMDRWTRPVFARLVRVVDWSKKAIELEVERQ